MFARNPVSNEFGPVSPHDPDGVRTADRDRPEFWDAMVALSPRPCCADRASNRTGAALDPCGHCRPRSASPGGSLEFVFLLGQAAFTAEAQSLIIIPHRRFDGGVRFRAPVLGRSPRQSASKTPDRALDSCSTVGFPTKPWPAASGRVPASINERRLWFPRPVVDATSPAIVKPEVARGHIPRAARVSSPGRRSTAAARNRARRSHSRRRRSHLACHVAAQYAEATGDRNVLDDGALPRRPALRPGERDSFFQPPSAMARKPVRTLRARSILRLLSGSTACR
jgi:cyclic beta-1,2-glucan synthetase